MRRLAPIFLVACASGHHEMRLRTQPQVWAGVRVHAVDGKSGKPAQGVIVYYERQHGFVETDATGVVRLPPTAPTTLYVIYGGEWKTIPVHDGTDVEALVYDEIEAPPPRFRFVTIDPTLAGTEMTWSAYDLRNLP